MKLGLIISGIILLVIITTLSMFNFFKKSSSYSIVETRDFVCSGLTGFTFKYPVFKGWEVGKVISKSPGVCDIWLSVAGFEKNDLYVSVAPRITVTKKERSKGQIPGFPGPASKKNPQGILYQGNNDSNDLMYFFAPDFYVEINAPSTAFGFSREQFFKTVIESFRLTDSAISDYDKAVSLANQELLKHYPDFKRDGRILELARVDNLANNNIPTTEWFIVYDMPGNDDLHVEIVVDVKTGKIISFEDSWA